MVKQVDQALAIEFGLSADEWQRILELLGRQPTLAELGMFSAMWSEHCSYKSSRKHLGTLPTTGPRVLIGPGENAGVIDIGDGLAVAFKMESHNHPSFIEPYQGAATGVGGILRDIFTMGARPIATLDPLRFGSPQNPRMRRLVDGVVHGIAGYGNAFGVPTVGGEVFFDDSFDGNILVNVMAVGLVRKDRIFLGRAEGPGNLILYFGSRTGRDGIHGATMASAEFDDASHKKRPTVQVGDPFLGKLLVECTLELMGAGVLVGIQDMGAAGLTSCSVEMAGRAGNGVRIDVAKVPRREPGMTAYECLLSESQERMLAVIEPQHREQAIAICTKWDLEVAIIGEVTSSGHVVIVDGDKVEVDVVTAHLADGPKYDRPSSRPAWQDEVNQLDLASVSAPHDLGATLLQLLRSPTIASKKWIYSQYDHQVRLGTVVKPGAGDAAVVRIVPPDVQPPPGGANRALAISTDCNPRFVFLDPYEGTRLAVAESYRNIACTGGEPVAVTNCLNFGNPQRPEIMWQLKEAIRGLGDACRALQTPVVSGNVSLYNETDGRAIKPTPAIGMVGIVEDARHALGMAFRRDGATIALLGVNTDELGGSEYLATVHGRVAGRPPRLDLERERALAALLGKLAAADLVDSAHDCAEGGLAVALAESCLGSSEVAAEQHGATVALRDPLRADCLLFGEGAGRVVISYPPAHAGEVAKLAAALGVPLAELGTVGGRSLRIELPGVTLDTELASLSSAYFNGFCETLAL